MTRWTLTFAPAASRDLSAIVEVIAENAGTRVAARWRRTFVQRTEALRAQPRLGAMDDDLGPGRRRLVVAPYLIVYELGPNNDIGILRIIHGARDLPGLFGDQGGD